MLIHFKVKHARRKICVLVCKQNMEVTWNNDLLLLLFNSEFILSEIINELYICA